MPRFRFSRRWKMAVLAIAAISFAVWTLIDRARQLSREYREKANWHGLRVYNDACTRSVFSLESRIAEARKRLAEKEVRFYEYHAAMKAKYDRAALTPWNPADPDPPEPDRKLSAREVPSPR